MEKLSRSNLTVCPEPGPAQTIRSLLAEAVEHADLGQARAVRQPHADRSGQPTRRHASACLSMSALLDDEFGIVCRRLDRS